MEGFLNWFFAFITQMLGGVWKILSGFGNGIVQIFNIPYYIKQFASYCKAFTALDWILSVIGFILVMLIWVVIISMIVLAIRKYLRFRKTVIGNEDLLEELADLHRDVLRLTGEKERLMALKVGQSAVSVDDINNIYAGGEGEKVPTYQTSANAVAKNETKDADKSGTPSPSGISRFFRLSAVDEKYEFYMPPQYNNDISLELLCETFRNFACSKMGLYYEKNVIRLLFAGLASTKLILLQGISGTGKTSLPYSMGKFFKHDATIASVQPSWRDRTELFGYFNEFTKRFNETEVLKRIYEASYNDDINVVVLDEMNIARVEYYFAEMLSVLEMPDASEWQIELVPSSWENDPKHLGDGKLQIPQNVWYVGTANNDDSTFAVSDKVYDRALVINLDSKGIAFDAPETEPMDISYSYVESLYKKAEAENPVSQKILDDISDVDMYVIQKFRIAFGNRIIKQLKVFVPVYTACGGTEIEGIDYILATKVFRKFESLNLSLIRDEIPGLIDYLHKVFGQDTMKESIAYLERLQKMY